MRNVLIVVAVLLVLVGGGVALKRSTKQTGPSGMAPLQTVTPTSGSNVQESAMAQKGTTPGTQQSANVSISLVVSSPASGTTVTSSKVTVKGKTAPKADVYVNELETVADSSGNFSVPVSLEEGENILIVMVVDSDGNAAQKEITLTYDAGE